VFIVLLSACIGVAWFHGCECLPIYEILSPPFCIQAASKVRLPERLVASEARPGAAGKAGSLAPRCRERRQTSPDCSRTGVARQRMPSMCSSLSIAKPAARICASSRRKSACEVIVLAVIRSKGMLRRMLSRSEFRKPPRRESFRRPCSKWAGWPQLFGRHALGPSESRLATIVTRPSRRTA